MTKDYFFHEFHGSFLPHSPSVCLLSITLSECKMEWKCICSHDNNISINGCHGGSGAVMATAGAVWLRVTHCLSDTNTHKHATLKARASFSSTHFALILQFSWKKPTSLPPWLQLNQSHILSQTPSSGGLSGWRQTVECRWRQAAAADRLSIEH